MHKIVFEKLGLRLHRNTAFCSTVRKSLHPHEIHWGEGVGEEAGGTHGGILNGWQPIAGKAVTAWKAAFTLYQESKSTSEVKVKTLAARASHTVALLRSSAA